MYRYKNPWKDKTEIENQNLEYFPGPHHIGHDYKERGFLLIWVGFLKSGKLSSRKFEVFFNK